MMTRRLFDWPGLGWSNALSEVEQMKRGMARLNSVLFGGPESRLLSSGVFPAINISEDKESYYVRAELPGINADEIEMQVTGRNLSIAGERKIESMGEHVKYHRREREAGSFSRIIALPGEVNAEKVKAKMIDGVLSVIIPKSEAAKPRQITIN